MAGNRDNPQGGPDVENVFSAARQIADAGERTAYLERACGGDAGLRAKVEMLLKADAEAGGFLATRKDGPDAQERRAAPPSPSHRGGLSQPEQSMEGQTVGRYKLLQLIGEGGFGAVYMAEQSEPVRRRVALKVIKPGMDSRMVAARFEAERQALALMDHPHIARVFDGGVTELSQGSRPYFVMEYVTGDPITTFADAHKLSLADRLELFTQVCGAVQHAHTKGIIHRDLKPGNVLVSMTDGRPFAKVIDFGIAKSLASRLTEKTLFTEHRQLIGTPEYMSPEQAEGSPDIDTRTDVYALGVLLYELLTGATPFDGVRLRSAAFGEMQRILKEEEPPAPSLRIARELGTLAKAAAARQAEPARLGTMVRGELDWIAMKAIDKDRARRYESAGQLAADVRRHLEGEAVVAAPPGAGYRVRKFVRRNRGKVVLAAAVGGALVVGLLGTTWQWTAARRANKSLEANRTEARSAMIDIVAMTKNWREIVGEKYDEALRAFGGTEEAFHRYQAEAYVDGFKHAWEDGPKFGNSAPPPADRIDIALLSQFSVKEVEETVSLRRSLEGANADLRAQRDAAESSAYTANLALAQGDIVANNFPGARRRLQEVLPDRRGWEWHVLSGIAQTVVWEDASPDGSGITAVAFSDDGNAVVVGNDANGKTTLFARAASSGAPLDPPPVRPSASFAGSVEDSGIRRHSKPFTPWLRTWDRRQMYALQRLAGVPDSYWYSASFSPDGRRLAIVSPHADAPVLRVVDVDQWGGSEQHLPFPGDDAQADRNAMRIASVLASSDGAVRFGRTITTPDGSRRIVAGHDRTIRFFDGTTGSGASSHDSSRELATFSMPDAIKNLQMTGDGTRLVISLEDGSVRIWDIREPVERLRDIEREWSERTPAGAYLDELWEGATPTESLRAAIISDASVSPLRRLVAAEMLQERLDDSLDAAADAFATIQRDKTDKASVRAAASAADLPRRVKESVLALAEKWEYRPVNATDAERLAEAKKKVELTEAQLREKVAELDASNAQLRGLVEEAKRGFIAMMNEMSSGDGFMINPPKNAGGNWIERVKATPDAGRKIKVGNDAGAVVTMETGKDDAGRTVLTDVKAEGPGADGYLVSLLVHNGLTGIRLNKQHEQELAAANTKLKAQADALVRSLDELAMGVARECLAGGTAPDDGVLHAIGLSDDERGRRGVFVRMRADGKPELVFHRGRVTDLPLQEIGPEEMDSADVAAAMSVLIGGAVAQITQSRQELQQANASLTRQRDIAQEAINKVSAAASCDVCDPQDRHLIGQVFLDSWMNGPYGEPYKNDPEDERKLRALGAFAEYSINGLMNAKKAAAERTAKAQAILERLALSATNFSEGEYPVRFYKDGNREQVEGTVVFTVTKTPTGERAISVKELGPDGSPQDLGLTLTALGEQVELATARLREELRRAEEKLRGR